MLMWPTIALLGFLVLAALVISLATSSTARYEFDRNRVQGQRQPAAAPAAAAPVAAAVAAEARPAMAPVLETTPAPREYSREQAAGMAAHPAGTRVAERELAAAWWLVDEGDDQSGERVVAGPFADRMEAGWAGLTVPSANPQRVVYGVPRPGGGLGRRQSPDEQAWLRELGEQLDRLPEDWDGDLSDDDADDDTMVTLVVEVAAALVEAGLNVHDCAGQGTAGGVCLTPEPSRSGVLVSWHQHERMSRDQVRGPETDAAVQHTMNAAVADCLRSMGFELESFGSTGCTLVVSAQRWW